MGKEYNTCVREIGKCVGLKKGVKGYQDCAKKSNCKKTERQKLEKIKGKIQKRNSVVKIGNFFHSAQNRINNLKIARVYIYDYFRYKESYDKPRIHKKTKLFYKNEMNKTEKRFKGQTDTIWWKTNYPNIKITDKNLKQQLYTSIQKLKNFIEEQSNKTYQRNMKNSKIRNMVDKSNDKRKEEKKRLKERKKKSILYLSKSSS